MRLLIIATTAELYSYRVVRFDNIPRPLNMSCVGRWIANIPSIVPSIHPSAARFFIKVCRVYLFIVNSSNSGQVSVIDVVVFPLYPSPRLVQKFEYRSGYKDSAPAHVEICEV